MNKVKTEKVREVTLRMPERLYVRWALVAADAGQSMHDLLLMNLEHDLEIVEPTPTEIIMGEKLSRGETPSDEDMAQTIRERLSASAHGA